MADPNVPIVYIDDDENSGEIVKTILKSQMGMNNLTLYNDSSNVTEKLSTLSVAPALVLLDLQMEPLTGFEVVRVIRENPALNNLKVIALTASVTSHDVQAI